jgi:hypothetical protein
LSAAKTSHAADSLSAVEFQVTLLLCDSAQAVGNKLYILGGGWSITGPDPVPSALALYIKVPWDVANEKHTLRLELLDSDGHPVTVETPIGDQPLVIENEFEVGRPPGLQKGTPIDLALAISLGPIPLAPDNRYEWRLSVNGEGRDHWRAAFSTRSSSGASGSVGSEGVR